MPVWPTNHFSAPFWALGQCVIGVDEVGAGALAGPVVAAACAWMPAYRVAVRDSKTLSARQRQAACAQIQAEAPWAVGMASVEEIDALGIRPANLLAMRRACLALGLQAHVLVDAYVIPQLGLAQTAIIRGDQQESCIAAASIVAKVTRDRLMEDADQTYPMYNFCKHKGYGTLEHRRALAQYGRCAFHRQTFSYSDGT